MSMKRCFNCGQNLEPFQNLICVACEQKASLLQPRECSNCADDACYGKTEVPDGYCDQYSEEVK